MVMSRLDGQIKHLVVLMMENRSFDHLLGYLTKEEGRSDIHGLTGRASNLNPLTGQSVFVHQFPPGATAFRPDPLHRYSDMAQQLGGHTNPARMEGFIRNVATATQGQGIDPGRIMGYYQKVHLPVYDFFANSPWPAPLPIRSIIRHRGTGSPIPLACPRFLTC
jgi:phospholipase C